MEMSSSKIFSDKNILITGGSRGLGFSVAVDLLLKGANIAICGRSKVEVKEAEKTLRSLKSKICKFLRFFKFQLINFSDLQFPRFSHSFREYFQDQLFEKHADNYKIRNVNLIILAYLPILIEF